MGTFSPIFIQKPLITTTKESAITSLAVPSKILTSLTPQKKVASIGNIVSQERFTRSSKSITTSQSYISHDPIKVASDAALAAVAVSGSGTLADPYVLENWNITTNRIHGIFIHDTTAHFLIRNCWIDTGRSFDIYGNSIYGIYLRDVAAGTAIIVNNTCQNNIIGIGLENSNYATITDNLCTQNYWHGIDLQNSGNATIANNTCQNNEAGIYLDGSGNSTIINNSFFSGGLYLSPWGHSMFSRYKVTVEEMVSYSIVNNWVNGNPLGFVKNQQDFTLTSSYGQLILVNCTNVIVLDQNCSNTNIGIVLYYSHHCQIRNSICSQNSFSGINLGNSNHSIVVNNTCSQIDGFGFFIRDSDHATVANNTCQNTIYGINFETSKYSLIVNNTSSQNSIYDIYLEDSQASTVVNNICQNSQLGIVFTNSEDSMIMNNTCQNNEYGIYLYDFNASTVSNNFCTQNQYYAIVFKVSKLSTIVNNTCQYNSYGMSLENSENSTILLNDCSYNNNTGISLIKSTTCVIYWNILTENQGYGISLDETSMNNTIHHNTFRFNHNGTTQAYDDGVNNYWYNAAVMEGNYWSDYPGTGIYELDGTAGVVDPSPLDELLVPIYADTDADGMPDWYEFFMGLEMNINDSMEDLDLDGLTNLEEYQRGTKANNPDSDVDGLTDGEEVKTYATDPLVPDSDTDGLTDGEEVKTYSTNPLNPDSDADRLTDGEEVKTYTTNPLKSDTDADGLTDSAEVNTYTTDPLNPDTDADELTDGEEVYIYTTDPTDADSDADGLTDGAEVQIYTTDPLNPDTDADGLIDGEEVYIYTTDPTVADSDADGLSDGDEVKKYNTDPLDSDSDNDLFPDGLDYDWWGNPCNRWDNPLSRCVLLVLMIGLVGLGLWASFIAYQRPKLQRDLNLLHQHFQQYVQQFQESITIIKTHESLKELEIASEHIDITFQSYEDFFSFAQHLVKPKWLPAFLRPEFTQWDATYATLKQVYEDFQQTRLKRLYAKY